MTEAEWLACNDEQGQLIGFASRRFDKDVDGDRKLRLIACACCRLAWHWFDDERSRRAIEVAELLADGRVKHEEVAAVEAAASQAVDDLAEARDAAQKAHGIGSPPRERAGNVWYIAQAAHLAIRTDRRMCERTVTAAWHTDEVDVDTDEQRAAHVALQCNIIRDVIGNPFRPITLAPAHRTNTVVSLARAAYDERQLPSGELGPFRLAVLADALEETGAPGELVAHLRGPGPHVRGCFAVDLCLGLS